MGQSAEWREKAAEFQGKAQLTKDPRLRGQFAELASRCVDIAEELEHKTVDLQWPTSTRTN